MKASHEDMTFLVQRHNAKNVGSVYDAVGMFASAAVRGEFVHQEVKFSHMRGNESHYTTYDAVQNKSTVVVFHRDTKTLELIRRQKGRLYWYH